MSLSLFSLWLYAFPSWNVLLFYPTEALVPSSGASIIFISLSYECVGFFFLCPQLCLCIHLEIKTQCGVYLLDIGAVQYSIQQNLHWSAYHILCVIPCAVCIAASEASHHIFIFYVDGVHTGICK
jgi:hypothetical protein